TVQLSGAGSSDEDGDALTFSWGVPTEIDVADKTVSVIQFTTPEVSAKTTLQFTLFVRDEQGEPSSQQRFVLTVVPAASDVQPEPADDVVPDEEDVTPEEDDVTPAEDN
ncbi:PKD domain-containing protein, partial [Salmonella enterica]